jgi:hypothetical protein
LFYEIESRERNSPAPLLVADQQQVIDAKKKKLSIYFWTNQRVENKKGLSVKPISNFCRQGTMNGPPPML